MWQLSSSLATGRRKRRGFVAALLIVNQFAIASGLPLPAFAAAVNGAAKKDLSKPFPCMNRPCGCKNADQCWRSCCCFTMRERLAWAEANGVEPPDFVREAAAREALADASGPPNSRGACREEKHCSCCECKARSATVAVCRACATREKISATTGVRPIRMAPIGRSRSVAMLMALGCQGQDLVGLLAQALPFARRPNLPYEAVPFGTISLRRVSFISYIEPPAVPPPEFFTAANLTGSVIEHG
jgi:hypothetical protein